MNAADPEVIGASTRKTVSALYSEPWSVYHARRIGCKARISSLKSQVSKSGVKPEP